MTLRVKVKQDKVPELLTLENIKHHYFDKNYLVITDENTNRHFYKISTVLSIVETK